MRRRRKLLVEELTPSKYLVKDAGKQRTGRAKYWMGSTPTKCDLCGQPLGTQFIDGKTIMGPWGILCTICHGHVGVGLGLGKGQLYQKEEQPDALGLLQSVWKKVAG